MKHDVEVQKLHVSVWGVGVNSYKGWRWSPSGHRRGDWSIWSGMTAQSGHVKSVRSTADVFHDGRPNLPDVGPPWGMWDRQSKKPHTCSLQATDSVMTFVAFVLWFGCERVNLILIHCTTEPNWYSFDFKALNTACSHSLSLLKISGPHWEVSLMTHKHISMALMWSRAYWMCLCARETSPCNLIAFKGTYSDSQRGCSAWPGPALT